MKKIFTLLWLMLLAISFKTVAQTTTCNAEFATQFINSNTVKFNPVMTIGPPTVTHTWSFGDGSPVDLTVSPTHVYNLPGTYTVVHTVALHNNGTTICTQSFTRQVTITSTPCNLVVDFSWTVSTANPLMLSFQNLSVPLASTDSVTWQFGDNSSSHVVNPVHTYANAGTYNVCLIVKKFPEPAGGPCIKYICKTVVVSAPCTLVVDFNWTVSTANPLIIQFHNLSTPIAATDSILWTFGDGSNSNQVSPLHTYASAGTYTVCLRIKKLTPPGSTPCVREICKTVVVTPPCNLVVDFNWTASTANPLIIQFHNLSTPIVTNDSIRWTFGDGSSSNVRDPLHTYAVPGTYTVCLRIIKYNSSNTNPCIREICKTVVVTQPCTLVVDFNWTVSSTNPLRYEFHNLSTPLAPADSTIWSFGDGTTSYDVNPVHTYANAGTYNVCLIVKKFPFNVTPACVRYLCKTVVVPPPCNMVVDFSWTAATANPLMIQFHNLTTPVATNDSIRWTFGDGTTSNAYNPLHTYTAPGTYTVCLRIIRYTAGSNTPCIRDICKTVVVTQPCTLVVDFNWTVTSTNPLRYEFHNLSTPLAPADSTIWSFGDGTTSYDVNPVHTYANAGTYHVCLIVKKFPFNVSPACVRDICKTVVVTPPCNLVVDFNWTVTPTNPLRYEFHNLTTPIATNDSIRWTFGDGTTSNAYNPVHTYTAPGTYTVCLRIIRYTAGSNIPCIREICKTIVVMQPCNLVVDFNWTVTSSNPLRYEFHNLSTPLAPADSTIWSFGDGTSSYDVNPVHTYANAGTYTVCLVVKKYPFTVSTPCVRYICKTIVVTPPCNFNVNFSWHLDSANHRKVYFTNLTTPPTATAFAVWTFGDGTSASTWNAVHEYAQAGTYIVCLRVYLSTNSTCVREKCDTVVIPPPVPPCTEISKFHYERSSTDNQKYTFTPDYINTTFHYTWSFGDGTGSQSPVAIHRYAQPGVYNACLTVWNGPNCTSTTCHEIHVQLQINCDSAHVSYTYQANPQVPNKISFYANATLPILDQTWTITRVGSTSPPVILHQNNPVYTFPDTGYYRVCLRASLLGGCVKEYCNYIHIEHVSNVCTLQAFPNPVSNVVNVNVYLTQAYMIHAYVYNSLNVLVMDKLQQGYTGNNLVSMTVNSLPAGQYTIRLVYGNSICYAAFQKL